MGQSAWARTSTSAARAAAGLLLLTATAACSGGPDGGGADGAGGGHGGGQPGPAIRVDHPEALADRAVHVRVTGLRAHDRVTVAATAEDRHGVTWRASGGYAADGHGVVDLAHQAPRGGRPYRTPDAMGLFTAMLPTGGAAAKAVGSGNAFSFHPPSPARQRAYRVRLTVGEAGGRRLATRVLTRRWLADGVRHRRLTVARDKADGELYTPPRGAPRRAPVLVFGGSEGGNAGDYAAALLASHGHPALSLCYFRCADGQGRPDAIDMIDLGYFAHAAALLGKQPGADPRRIAVMGNSRGSEAAQLLGQRYPSLVRDVIAYAPSSKVIGPYPAGRAAWAQEGRPVPTGPIPLDHVRGTVLAVAGGNDRMWGSAASARAVAAQHNASGTPHQALEYPGAGHHVNWFPYGQPGQDGGADGDTARTSAADQTARADGWPRVLRLLAR